MPHNLPAGISTHPNLREIRGLLRNNATNAEEVLWNMLKKSQLDGRKFRRQHSIGRYVVDFFCPSEMLAVELDGAGHYMAEGVEADMVRDIYLADLGIWVLRFENRMVFECLEDVLHSIRGGFR